MMMTRPLAVLLLLASTGAAFRTSSLARPVSSPSQVTTSQLFGNTKPRNISYGEESRRFRRTVYDHDAWVKHRSNRFVRSVLSITTSGIYKNIGKEVLTTTAIAAFVVIWNTMCAGGFKGFDGVLHEIPFSSRFLKKLSLPLVPFTLASPSLGLLLVFRTNSSYSRWDEARKAWGMNINHTRDLVRMGTSFYDKSEVTDEEREEDLNRLSRCTWAFVRSMKRHLSPDDDEEDFKTELYQKLPAGQADAVMKATHRPNRALHDLSMAIENLPMHFLRKNQMHKSLTIFEDNLGGSERLLTSPVPLFYSRHTARFLSFWLLLLPFALYDAFANSWNHLAMIPTTSVISLFLFGIEELATQMEEPFTILPMQAFCDKIGNWCNEIVSFGGPPDAEPKGEPDGGSDDSS